MESWFRTLHAFDTNVDISSVAFWSRDFVDREKSFAELRRTRPVSWHPQLETPGLSKRNREAGFWAITRVEEIAYVSRHPEVFSSEIGQVGLRPAPFRIDPNMLVTDPPAHTELRRMVATAFSAAELARIQRAVERSALQIVGRAALKERFDVVADVAAPLPLITLATLLGIPYDEQPVFCAAADRHVRGGLPGILPVGVDHREYFADASRPLASIVVELAARKRSRPADDLMSRLVAARIDGRPLDDSAILSTVMLLIVAGDDTTKQAITLSLLALDAFPTEKAWLLDDFDARFDQAFDELIRFASPVISFARTVMHDVELAGSRLSAGDKVGLFYCSGNRDEREFPEPDRLTLQRAATRHVGFGGGGVHFCLGARLARLQVRSILREIFVRMPHLRLGRPEYGFGESVHSVTKLQADRSGGPGL